MTLLESEMQADRGLSIPTIALTKLNRRLDRKASAGLIRSTDPALRKGQELATRCASEAKTLLGRLPEVRVQFVIPESASKKGGEVSASDVFILLDIADLKAIVRVGCANITGLRAFTALPRAAAGVRTECPGNAHSSSRALTEGLGYRSKPRSYRRYVRYGRGATGKGRERELDSVGPPDRTASPPCRRAKARDGLPRRQIECGMLEACVQRSASGALFSSNKKGRPPWRARPGSLGET